MKTKVDFSESEKFRAELYKHLSLVLLSPFCFILFEILVHKKELEIIRLGISIVSAVFGYLTVVKSYGIMYDRDVLYGKRLSDVDEGKSI